MTTSVTLSYPATNPSIISIAYNPTLKAKKDSKDSQQHKNVEPDDRLSISEKRASSSVTDVLDSNTFSVDAVGGVANSDDGECSGGCDDARVENETIRVDARREVKERGEGAEDVPAKRQISKTTKASSREGVTILASQVSRIVAQRLLRGDGMRMEERKKTASFQKFSFRARKGGKRGHSLPGDENEIYSYRDEDESPDPAGKGERRGRRPVRS